VQSILEKGIENTQAAIPGQSFVDQLLRDLKNKMRITKDP
jgi:hypothetical protein